MTLKKRIVHVSTVHSWHDPRIFEKQCRSLSKIGYDVHLITNDGIDEEIEGVFVHKLEKQYKNRVLRFFLASRRIFKQAESLNPDIIHFHDPELILESLKSSKRGFKIIYDIHEDNLTSIDHREYIPKFLKSLIRSLVSRIENIAHKKLNTIIAEKYYAERFPLAEPILNYPIKGWQNNIHKEISNCLIYTGTIRKERGALIHAEIINHSKEVEVWNIGRCDRKTQAEMILRVGNERDRLVIPIVESYVPFTEIIDYYNSKRWLAGLALFPPSKHIERKQLTKLFEYMSVGIPIIYSDFDEWKNLLEPLDVGISVNPNDLTEIGKAVKTLKENKDLYFKYSNNGVSAFKNKFNWDIEEKKLGKIYSKLLRGYD